MARPGGDSAGVYFVSREAFEARGSRPAPGEPLSTCGACASTYYTGRSTREELCPQCAHDRFGDPACGHVFHGGRCARCYWDGATPAFLEASSAPAER